LGRISEFAARSNEGAGTKRDPSPKKMQKKGRVKKVEKRDPHPGKESRLF